MGNICSRPQMSDCSSIGSPSSSATDTGHSLRDRRHKALCRTFTTRVNQFYDRGDGYRLLKDIVPGCTFARAKELVQKIKETPSQRNGQFWAVIYHPETAKEGHCHLFHRCLYYGSYCRCAALRGTTVKRRRARYTPQFDECHDLNFWTNWLFYFLQEPRRILYLEIAGLDFSTAVCGLEGIPAPEPVTQQVTSGLVERGLTSCKGADWHSELGSDSDGEAHAIGERIDDSLDRRGKKSAELPVPKKRNQLKSRDTSAFILEQLEKLLVIPVDASCDTETWLRHPQLKFYNRSDPDYKKACSVYLRATQFLNFTELYQLHTRDQANAPLYYQRTSQQYYFSVEESLAHCEHLLLVQYATPEQMVQFLFRLYEVCERIQPKKNTMVVTGPPNSGKSWFFEMVAQYHLNVGHVKNFVRSCAFPLNDCINRRILMWNEPSIAPSQFETVKMLAGGDPCPAAIKYEGDGKILRTPLLITTNTCPFAPSPVWSSRCHFEQWLPAPFLSSLDYYPHPLTYYALMKKYVVE